jgi:hypothetical protein
VIDRTDGETNLDDYTSHEWSLLVQDCCHEARVRSATERLRVDNTAAHPRARVAGVAGAGSLSYVLIESVVIVGFVCGDCATKAARAKEGTIRSAAAAHQGDGEVVVSDDAIDRDS